MYLLGKIISEREGARLFNLGAQGLFSADLTGHGKSDMQEDTSKHILTREGVRVHFTTC